MGLQSSARVPAQSSSERVRTCWNLAKASRQRCLCSLSSPPFPGDFCCCQTWQIWVILYTEDCGESSAECLVDIIHPLVDYSEQHSFLETCRHQWWLDKVYEWHSDNCWMVSVVWPATQFCCHLWKQVIQNQQRKWQKKNSDLNTGGQISLSCLSKSFIN